MTRPPISELSYDWRSPKAQRPATERIIVHHSAADAAFDAEDVHRWHLDQGWRGIGYHFVITPTGAIQSGRELDAVGAHCLGGWNSRSVAVCLAGNFERSEPTRPQVAALIDLCAWLCQEFRLDPLTSITGHCDQQPTACPGVKLYSRLGETRQTVRAKLHGEATLHDLAPTPFADARDRLMALGITDGTEPSRPATRGEVWLFVDRLLTHLAQGPGA